ncbi:MAG: hypothetical protein WC149_00230 [Arcobacteraceae bacterium]
MEENKVLKMNIIITKHSRRRRKHQKIIDKDLLIDFIKQIDELFFISHKENNIYKVGYRNKIAIIKKSNNALVLITVRGFEKDNFKIDNIDLKLLVVTDRKKS